MKPAIKQPLEGVKVVDLTRLLPGGFLTMILADLGAEVIKIEEPVRGDYGRETEPLVQGTSAKFLALHRNKKSLALDLKTAEGREIFLKLVSSADALIESFRPGVVARLGIGYEDVKKIRENIVYVSLSGYGQTGPYRMKAGHDINFSSLTGVTQATGFADGPPVINGIPVSDIGAGGLFGALATLSALYSVKNGGPGTFIDLSLMDGSLSLFMYDFAEYLLAGRKVQRGKFRINGGLPSYQIYETADGGYMAVGALEPKFWKIVCEAAGRDDLSKRESWNSVYDPEGIKEMASVFKSRTRAEWESIFEGLDACVTPVLDINEIEDNPQIKDRGLITEINDEAGWGRLKMVGTPFTMSAYTKRPMAPAPALGEHSREILSGLGYDEKAFRELCEKGIVKMKERGKP